MKIRRLSRLYIIFALLMWANLSMAEIQRWTCQPPSVKEFPSFVKKYYADENIPISFDYDTESKKLLSVRIFNYNNELEFVQHAQNIYRVIGNLDKEKNVFYVLDWYTNNQTNNGNRLYGYFAISKYRGADTENITDHVELKGCTYTVLKNAEHKASKPEAPKPLEHTTKLPVPATDEDCAVKCTEDPEYSSGDDADTPLVPKKRRCHCTVS